MKVACRICNAPLEQTFVDLGEQPLANSYVKPERRQQKDPAYPLHVFLCTQCHLVQLPEWEHPEAIFTDYAYFSSFSDSWLAHAKKYTEDMMARFGLNASSQVVEIASNDGYLLQYFKARGIRVLGVEPAKNVAEAALQKGIPTKTIFFSRESARALKEEGYAADLLLGNNVFAHVPDLHSFVEGLSILLKPQGIITLEFPYLLELMRFNQFDTIYHEHFSYLALKPLEPLFARYGLRIFDVAQLPTHGGSLRLFVTHVKNTAQKEQPTVEKLRQAEKAAALEKPESYAVFQKGVKAVREQLLAFLADSKKAGKKVVGYGAPAKGNTLLNYAGITADLLTYTVDRSPHKQGLFLPGSHIPIRSVDALRETKPDFVLILPWNLREEIKEQIAFIKDWGGQFVVAVPQLETFS